MFSVDGLVSGLDTTSIVEGALSLQQSRLDRLAVQKQEIAEEQTAFKTIEAQLYGLQGSLGTILRSSNSAFDNKLATSSDEEALAVSASSSAAVGTYRLRVTQLAQAHQIKSNEFSSGSQKISRGTFGIRVGNRAETEIIITDANNTLQGLADAINAQSNDVTAAVIDDGSKSATPVRLLITSRHSGSENQISIRNSLGGRRPRGSKEELAQIDFSGIAVQEALDAQVQLGSGDGAITVSSTTNQFEDLFAGITFDAFRADPEKQIQITVEENTQQVTEAIGGFVEAFNSVMEFIDTNSNFDSETNSAGLLLGNRSAASVQSRLRAAVSTVVDGVNENLRTLSAVGISTNSQGKLVLDRSRLSDILAGRIDGVGLDDIRRLFAIDGRSDNPGIQFVLATNKTQASPLDPKTGIPIPYEVEINGVATNAAVEGAFRLLKETVISDQNNIFEMEVDKVPISIRLANGGYSREELAQQIQVLVNTSPERAGREIVTQINDDRLQIKTASFGRSSSIRILSGNANGPLGVQEGQSASGTDVAGVFRVQLPGTTEKITEKATGNGRLLAGNPENEYTAQLQVRSNLDRSQIGSATDARLTVTRGIGAALDAAIDELLDGRGEISTAQERYTLELEAIDQNMERVQARLEARRESLIREFAALESTLAELQSVGSALASGLTSALTL